MRKTNWILLLTLSCLTALAVWQTCHPVGAKAGLAQPNPATPSRYAFTVARTAAAALATIRVDSLDDGVPVNDGRCTLREALLNANGNNQSGSADCIAGSGADTINFAVTGTITLTAGELVITEALTIQGPGANQLTISGNNASRVFRIAPGDFDVTLAGLTIANGNVSANARSNVFGGGLYNASNGTVNITNSTLSGNSAPGGDDDSSSLTKGGDGSGGGVYNTGSGTINITNSTLSSNSARGGEARGGDSKNEGGNGFGGGIYHAGSGTINITNSTLSGNSARGGHANTDNGDSADNRGGDGLGGGIHNAGGGTVNLTNSTLADNYADFGGESGGGFGSDEGDDRGGGIYNPTNGTVTVRNTIIAGNSAFRGTDVHGAFSSQGYNLIGNTENSTGFGATGDKLNQPARLGPLENNGGPTRTHALLPGSPAIDAGNGMNAPATDQRGSARLRDGNNDGTAHLDIGAYELALLVVDNTTDDGALAACTDAPNDCSLRGALTTANAQAGADEILFAANVTGTINLTGALPNITDSLTISGPGAPLLTVRRSTGGDYRIFHIPDHGLNIAISGLTLSNGSAVGSSFDSYGGGILSFSYLALTDCVISGNAAWNEGGGVVMLAGGVFTGCTISNNTAGNRGGGISFQGVFPGSSLRLNNCTISGNSANGGGGIYNQGGTGVGALEVTNCTIADNSSGIWAVSPNVFNGGYSATTRLRNNLIANTSPNLEVQNGVATSVVTSLGHNLVSDGGGGFFTQPTDLVNTTPLLSPLSQNGGPTPTHALLPGSPAINAGDNCVLTNACASHNLGFNLMTDQRGFNRQVGSAVDIGAYESRGFTLAIVGGNNQTTPVTQGFVNPLVVGVSSVFNEPVAGGRVTFTAPTNGASATFSGNPATINANGQASVGATANTQPGFYPVSAATNGAVAVTFNLINFCPPLIFTTALTPPTCNGGTNGELEINVGGGVGTLMYSINNGQSFQFGPVFTGLAAGTYQVMIKDASACPPVTASVTLTQPAALSLSPATLPISVAGQPFTQNFTASGGTGAKSVSLQGAVPNWLNFNPVTATLSGTAPQPATVSFSLTVTDQANCTASFNYTLQFVCPTLTLTPATLTNGVQGAAYNQTLTASPTGTTYSYALTTGALPPGLTLASNGTLSGTPTAAGNYAFGVTVTGWGTCTKQQSYNLLITGTCATVTLNPSTLPSPTVGAAYQQIVSASGGTGPYTFSLATGALPAGVILNASTGVISGTPTMSGTYSFSLRATAQGGCSGSRSYVVVVGCGTLIFTPNALPNGMRGVTYSQQLSVGSGSNATFSLLLGSLPPGVSLSSTGLLSGMTSQTGTYNFTVKAVLGTCQGTKAYTLVISNGSQAALALSSDYDGDGKADPALWSTQDGTWRIVKSSDGQSVNERWGTAGDVTLLGDYDGDGKSDLAVFRPTDATFYVKRSSDGQFLVQQWGLATDMPVPGDYDGDGKTDLAVWRGLNGTWYIARSSDGQYDVQAWGAAYAPYLDVPVAGDFDGDGKSDLAIFRRSTGMWLIKRSSDSQYVSKLWGLGTDTPVPADYDRDGLTDIAVWRPAEGNWYIWQSATNVYRMVRWGVAGDEAGAGDYDGDGQADAAVWRSAERSWHISGSRAPAPQQILLGQAGDALVGAKMR